MPNPYFQFKQFLVRQDGCAMKVCTDACVLGAAADLTGATRILDVGTGTGLLALMAAQRTAGATIEAVELDVKAAGQAADNVGASPWGNRIRVHAQSLQEFAATFPPPFDHILCNPPFFRNSLRSPDAARTTARHTAPDTLSFAELAGFAQAFLLPAGRLTVLLPPPEMAHFEQDAAATGLYPLTRLVLQHSPTTKPLRHITAFGRQQHPCQQTTLPVYEAGAPVYSPAFRKLLQDFYLAF
ncbi:methyltransferase [Hymenobacter sp. BT175]|uniref:tRNA1(Val) (adenine(37)-N6)-methyltransferase n=1 Tax=Hymenobacter translucens TaxID=2886507 RepID=UPI001D0E1DF9|nr:methyltransferase [Hymenobacter translucens]MCC2545073.1 methyltransferase [Hymenobacter translucens]